MDEKAAFKAGLAIALVMLASGFLMLFIPLFTGDGAMVLSLGVMTMVVVLMMKVLVVQIQQWMDYNARIEDTVSEVLSFRSLHSSDPTSPETRTKRGKPRSSRIPHRFSVLLLLLIHFHFTVWTIRRFAS